MSIPAYKEYRDSGLEELGLVPKDWELSRSDKYIVSRSESISVASMEDKKVFHYSIPCVQQTGTGQLEDGSEIDSSKLRISSPQVLVSKLNPRKGTVCVANPQNELTVSSGEFVPLSSPSIEVDYLFYLAVSETFRQRLESLVESATRSHQRAAPSDIAKFWWVFPSQEEQQKIAAFLDHETAKIDALIAEQKRLIELLKEKRQAVISHAVTKGLNPNATMKDSGVEWLGEVPAHWKESRLGELVEFQQGKAHEPYIDDDGEHFCVNSRFVSTEGRSVKRSHLNLTPAKVGDVLMVMSDLPNGRALAKAYLVGDEHSYAVNQRVCRIRSRGCLPRFLFYLMDRHPQLLSENDGVNQTHLSNDSFKKLHLHMPPIVEQREIADYLFERSSMFAELLIESERSIFLLKERRSALISAAVTGKIDVRDWQPSKSTSPERVLQAAEEAASYG